MLRAARPRGVAARLRRGYVNTSSSLGADPALMRSLSAVGQRLEVRALIVDAALFRRAPSTGATRVPSPLAFADPKPGVVIATDAMLTKHVRDELKARGVDAIGKPRAVRERLAAARAEAEAEEASAVDALAGGARERLEEAPPPPPAAVGIAAKYAARLSAKGGAGAGPAPAGDAALLSASRDAARKTDAETSRWRMGPSGLSNLLAFAAGRSMSVALVGRADTTDTELGDLMKQADGAFDVVAPAASGGGGGGGSLAAALATLALEPHRVLAVTEPDALEWARAAGVRTCVLRDGDWEPPARRDRRPDFDVDECAEVQLLINDLNGISFR